MFDGPLLGSIIRHL